MDIARLRAWWWRRQGLDGGLAGATPAQVLERAGWMASTGGVAPYLGFFARAGIGRDAVDAAGAALQIHEVPGAAGRTYLVPASDFGLALRIATAFRRPDKAAEKLGVTAGELERLAEKALDAVRAEPAGEDRILAETEGSVRNLGEEGARLGFATTLTLALEKLQTEGHIRRIPAAGRLDRPGSRYAVWEENPARDVKLSPAELHMELARRYFRWIGPASLQEFRRFAGLSANAARQAVAPLELIEAAETGGRLLFRDELDEWRAAAAPRRPQYALTGSLDPFALLRGDLRTLIDLADSDTKVFSGRSLAVLDSLSKLPSHAIFDRGRLTGLWEFDPGEGRIVWNTFSTRPEAVFRDVVERAELFVRGQLGDARAYSADPPEILAQRIAVLRRGRRV